MAHDGRILKILATSFEYLAMSLRPALRYSSTYGKILEEYFSYISATFAYNNNETCENTSALIDNNISYVPIALVLRYLNITRFPLKVILSPLVPPIRYVSCIRVVPET